MTKLKVMTIVGTRPEIIRLSRIISLCDHYFDHTLVHTGQNYDFELNEVFFQDLQVRKPDEFMNVDTTSLGSVLGDVLKISERVLIKYKPDAVLILGDTNSSLSAVMAKRLRIPIFHMEAGNRCFDMNVPEEINRRIVDHIADFNLVYTENARNHLLSEGLPHRRIYNTGSPMTEVLSFYKKDIENSNILASLNLQKEKYFIVSVHREENVDNENNLRTIIDILNSLSDKYDYPVVVSTHPRTRKRLEKVDIKMLSENVRFLKPFGFFDYVYLQKEAYCTISDSGTISEESSILGFPAISLRNSMERPEAQDSGSILLSGLDKNVVLNSVDLVRDHLKTKGQFTCPVDYEVSNTSWRVLKLLQGLSKLSNSWDGIVGKL